MNAAKKKTNKAVKMPSVKLPGLSSFSLSDINPWILIAVGAAFLMIMAAMFMFSGNKGGNQDAVLAQAQQSMQQVGDVVQNFRGVLEDLQVQELAAIAIDDPDKIENLKQYVSGRISDVQDLMLFDPQLDELRGKDLGPDGYALLDMLWKAKEGGIAPVQYHSRSETPYLAMAVRIGEEASPKGLLFAKINPQAMLAAFQASLASPGIMTLEQYNGRYKSNVLSPLASPPTSAERMVWLPVAGSILRIGGKQTIGTTHSLGVVRPTLFIAGLFFITLGIALKLRPARPAVELQEDPEPSGYGAEQAAPEEKEELPAVTASEADHRPPGSIELDMSHVSVELPDLGFNLEKMSVPHAKSHPPVGLVESIFRAYDIRGIVGETLDANVTRQVGKVIGSMALDQDATPVVVGRDGRDSGPDLVEGMIEGIASTGCDVIDIGAVPTGVLYFAAYELGNGSGVMITGSHNPPEYNGIKMLIGGETLAGEKITGMYKRIQSRDFHVGKGETSRLDMLQRYRDRISGDIQLERPLKVVADCGNGIGGVVAADVLRDIGAEVITLYEEVDGTFPNHHPDPSEPKNLVDLIEAVEMMNADIGVAFDGDADRLGVVTSDGQIIYSDRLMMLFVKDVLSRVPGSTIIYDVKCTGHLHKAIEDAGGKAMMYKTGHSLIKNKMIEVNSPFAGEMSGHFFFKERWYGFDCGIYSAARLLEILAADSRNVEEILNELPNSVSTPELKLEMQEGETHAFVAEMQQRASFPDARINTIDGVRADFEDGWGLVRASNTTPILVIRFDADNEEALQRIKDDFAKQMLAINPSLELPF
jgi:phosphomannomutase/phosphoglucomutase